jgi:hypothetical protein
MLKGVWSFNVRGQQVAFTSGIIVVLDDNRFVGGDSSYYFTGVLSQDGAHISSEVAVKHHFGPRLDALETFDRFTVMLSGTANAAESIVQLAGSVAENPKVYMLVGMSKLENLD